LPPIFQPEAIADVVCRAARNPPRELWLGFSALKAIAGGMAAAGLLDRYLAKKGYEGQFTREPKPQQPIDNLFAPACIEHAVHGRFSRRSRPKVGAFRPSVLRMALAIGSASLLVSAFAIMRTACRRA